MPGKIIKIQTSRADLAVGWGKVRQRHLDLYIRQYTWTQVSKPLRKRAMDLKGIKLSDLANGVVDKPLALKGLKLSTMLPPAKTLKS